MTDIETNYTLASVRPSFPVPEGQTAYQPTVAVIGGGFCGLSTALELRAMGYSVLLLDRGKIGSGASGHSGGHICYGFQRSISLIHELLGLQKTAKLFSYTVDGVGYLQKLIADHAIQCDLRMGYIEVGVAHSDIDVRNHLHSQIEYRPLNARVTDASATAGYLATDSNCTGIYSEDMGQLEPYAFAIGMARKARELGVMILEDTKALSIHYVAGLPVITTENGITVSPQIVLCAAGSDTDSIPGLVEDVKHKALTVHTTMLATEPLDDALIKQIMPNGRIPFADLNDGDVSYGRIDHENRLVFGCGESAGNPDVRYVKKRLYKMIPIFQKTGIAERVCHWSGSLSVTANFIPHVGRSSTNPRILFAHGLGGIGIVWGVRLGKTLALASQGLIEGKAECLEELTMFEEIKHIRMPSIIPQRFMPRIGLEMTKKPKLYKSALSLLDRIQRS